MSTDKDKKKKYNLRKKSKKKYKKQTDSDESDSDWSPDCDDDYDDDMDLLEYQKFIQKIFPSKSGKERVNQLEKIDKLVKKNKKKAKKSSSEDDEYDEVEELKNSLGENAKFNIIFTIGDPNGNYDDFDEWEEENIEENGEENRIISKVEEMPADRLFEVKQRVWVKTPKMKTKKAGTVKKCYNKKK